MYDEPWDLQRQMCRQTISSCEKQQLALAEQHAMMRRQRQGRVFTRLTSPQTPEIVPDISAGESTIFQLSTERPGRMSIGSDHDIARLDYSINLFSGR